MNKQKGKASPPLTAGVLKPETIKDVAESLGITNLPDGVASALASDLEYRVRAVVEEAYKFTRHSRRTTMTTNDIDNALRVMNIEPLYGHSPHNPPQFRKAPPHPQASASGTVYFVEDEEIDFERVLREEKIALPKPMTLKAHWLAIEGVQPLSPDNVAPIPREFQVEDNNANASPSANVRIPLTPQSPSRTAGAYSSKKENPLLVKHVLSRELQLYYTRLTSALLPPGDITKRNAALASLRYDAGLQPLLPYLVKWVGDDVVGVLKSSFLGDAEGKVLEVLLDVIGALLENATLFVEPYLHQLLPPLLSVLLYSNLPPSQATYLRTLASSILSHLLRQHSTTYPSLSPRIMKTLLVALISPDKSHQTREGAVRGLMGVGKEAVRKGLVEGGGAKVIGSECKQNEDANTAVITAVMEALEMLASRSRQPRSLNPSNADDAHVLSELRQFIGDLFMDKVSTDAEWANGILHGGADVKVALQS